MADRFLPTELLSIIGYKLECTGDRIRFRAVAKSWRSALPFRQPPWLMLSESEEEVTQPLRLRLEEEVAQPQHQPRGFVSLGDQAIYKIDFPEIHQARVVGSSGNWLITIHSDKTLRLSNPFSKLQYHLPSHFKIMLEYGADSSIGSDKISQADYRNELVFKVVPSSSQPNSSNTCWVAIVFHHYTKVLAITRPGDTSWTPALFANFKIFRHQPVEDVIFYKQHVYAINDRGKLMACDVGDGRKPPQLWYLSNGSSCLSDTNPGEPKHYLVEWLGELLMVVRYIEYSYKSHVKNAFKIYKFDFANRNFDKLKSLGDHSLFLGYNTSVSVLASDYFGLVRSNCIYFTDDYRIKFIGDKNRRDMGVFDLEDNSITPHFKGTCTSLYSSPVWIIPA